MPPQALDVPGTVKLSLSPGESVAKRVASLKLLQEYFQGPEAGGRVLRWLPSILPQLLPLLAEPQPEVRAAAAPCLGVLGAQAAVILPSPVSSQKTASHNAPAVNRQHQAAPHPLPLPALYGRSQRQVEVLQPPRGGRHNLQQQQVRKGPGATQSSSTPYPPTSKDVALKPVPASDPPNAFFNWCLEALSRDAGPGVKTGTALSAGVKETLLSSLKLCLERLPRLLLAKHAARIMDVCMAVLEAETTGLSLVRPLLSVMNLASPALDEPPGSASTIPHSASLPSPGIHPVPSTGSSQQWGSRFTDLMDILLGWWLDPAFTTDHREEVSQLVVSLGERWSTHLGFANDIARNLVDDLEALSASKTASAPPAVAAAGEVRSDSAASFKLLSGALAAFIAPAASTTPQSSLQLLQLLPRLLKALLSGLSPPCSTRPADVLSTAAAAGSCLGIFVSALICGCCGVPQGDRSLSHSPPASASMPVDSTIRSYILSINGAECESMEDASFWAVNLTLKEMLLPALSLPSGHLLLAPVLSSMTAMLRCLCRVNPQRVSEELLAMKPPNASMLTPRVSSPLTLLPVAAVASFTAQNSTTETPCDATEVVEHHQQVADQQEESKPTSAATPLLIRDSGQSSGGHQWGVLPSHFWAMRSSSSMLTQRAMSAFLSECLLLPAPISAPLLSAMIHDIRLFQKSNRKQPLPDGPSRPLQQSSQSITSASKASVLGEVTAHTPSGTNVLMKSTETALTSGSFLTPFVMTSDAAVGLLPLTITGGGGSNLTSQYVKGGSSTLEPPSGGMSLTGAPASAAMYVSDAACQDEGMPGVADAACQDEGMSGVAAELAGLALSDGKQEEAVSLSMSQLLPSGMSRAATQPAGSFELTDYETPVDSLVSQQAVQIDQSRDHEAAGLQASPSLSLNPKPSLSLPPAVNSLQVRTQESQGRLTTEIMQSTNKDASNLIQGSDGGHPETLVSRPGHAAAAAAAAATSTSSLVLESVIPEAALVEVDTPSVTKTALDEMPATSCNVQILTFNTSTLLLALITWSKRAAHVSRNGPASLSTAFSDRALLLQLQDAALDTFMTAVSRDFAPTYDGGKAGHDSQVTRQIHAVAMSLFNLWVQSTLQLLSCPVSSHPTCVGDASGDAELALHHVAVQAVHVLKEIVDSRRVRMLCAGLLHLAAGQALQNILEALLRCRDLHHTHPSNGEISGTGRVVEVVEGDDKVQQSAGHQHLSLVPYPAILVMMGIIKTLSKDPLPEVRKSALVPALTLSLSYIPSSLQLRLQLLSALVTTALEGMADMDSSVSSASAGLLVSLSGAALSASLQSSAPVTTSSWHPELAGIAASSQLLLLPEWHHHLGAADVLFRPEQLLKLFDLLVPDSAVLGGVLLKRKQQQVLEDGTDSAMAGTVDSTSTLSTLRSDAEAFLRLLSSLQPRLSLTQIAVPPSNPATHSQTLGGRAHQASISGHQNKVVSTMQHTHRQLRALGTVSRHEVAWQLIQTAARSCVTSRMITHAGGPYQTFAALERMLRVSLARMTQQAAASGPSSAASRDHGLAAGVPQSREAVLLVLELMGALERAIHHAGEGGRNSPPFQQPLLAFFAANERVCADWLTKTMRPLLLQVSCTAQAHYHAVHHGCLRLADLRGRLKVLQATRQQALAALTASTSTTAATTSAKVASAASGVGATAAAGGAGAGKAAHTSQPQKSGPGSAASVEKKRGGTVAAAPAAVVPTVLQLKKNKGMASVPGQSSVLQGHVPPGPSTAHAATTSGPAQALQSANDSLSHMAVEVFKVLQQVSASMLALQDGEGLLGLHTWSCRAFEPLLLLLKQQHSLAMKQLQKQQAHLPSGAESKEELGLSWPNADGIDGEEDTDLPFGDAPRLASRGKKQHGTSTAAASPAVATSPGRAPPGSTEVPTRHCYEGYLPWLHALALQAQGRYEHAAKEFSSFLSQEPWFPSTTSKSSNAASGAASAQESFSNSTHMEDVLSSHMEVRLFVAERLAECYASVADWSGLHKSASEHQGMAAKDTNYATWWAEVSQKMQSHFATASYDVAPGPSAVDVTAFKLDAPHNSLLASIQAAHQVLLVSTDNSSNQQQVDSSRVAATQQAVAAATASLEGAWRVLSEDIETAGLMEGLPQVRQHLILVTNLNQLASRLNTWLELQQRTGSQKGLAPWQQGLSFMQQLTKQQNAVTSLRMPAALSGWPWCSHHAGPVLPSGGPPKGLSLGTLLLPASASAAMSEAGAAVAADVSTLLQLHRVARVCDALDRREWSDHDAVTYGPCYPHASKALLLQTVHSARTSSNFALCARMLPNVLSSFCSTSSSGQKSSGSQVPVDMPSSQAASAAMVECLVSVLQIEAHGAPSLLKSVSRMLTALRPFIMEETALQSLLSVKISTIEDTTMTWDLAHAFLASSSWLSRSPAAVTSGASVAAGVNWAVVLKNLHSASETQQHVMQQDCSDATAAVAALAIKSCPASILLGHPAESACTLLALTLCPDLSAAWLQWGNLLYAWTKEQRQASKAQAAAVGKLGGALTLTPSEVSSEGMDGYGAVVQALSQYLRLTAGSVRRVEDCSVGQKEQHLPLLLRLLKIIVRHGPSLETSLSESLSSFPATVWQPAAPQLLAQLPSSTTPEAARRLLLSRLSALAADSPLSLLYPCVVEARIAESAEKEMTQELRVLIHQLESSQPRMVSELRVFMSEAQRVTVTWEERWHALLGELQADVGRRFVTLQAEATRLADKAALIGAEQRNSLLVERYKALMSPIMLLLERNLKSNAAAEPETPYERWFLRQVLPRLRSAMTIFKKPPSFQSMDGSVDLSSLQASWQPVKAVLQLLSRAMQQPLQDLRQLSPSLANLKNSMIPLPGHETLISTSSDTAHSGEGLFLSSVAPLMTVLPTKTRPKKLDMLGSNGHAYVYLLKGRDDLRADEKLMQVMRSVNALLRSDPTSAKLGLSVRHYSVTPLGERTGLIQWVRGTFSLFSLFRQWQADAQARQEAIAAARKHAEATAAAMAATSAAPGSSSSGSAVSSGARITSSITVFPPLPQLPVMALSSRPADLFYARLVPALAEAGVSGGLTTPRKEWPLDVLKKVLLQLVSEAPKDILSNELWCGSGSAAAHWHRKRKFGVSLAATSVVGYLLGIGDRHMDNILLDQESAELVHIDYNVCFEKGAKLRIPEVVPFRLTQVLAVALGPVGPEGLFRTCLETGLTALRTRREGLAALLDAVLGDPGVEWSAEREDAAARQDLELAVSLQLFASRMEELRDQLQIQVSELLPALDGPGGALCGYIQAHAFLAAGKQAADEAREKAAEAQATLEATAAEEAAAGAAAQAASSSLLPLLEEMARLRTAAEGALQECMHWTQQHFHTLAMLRDGGLDEQLSGMWKFAQSDTPLLLLSLEGAPHVSAHQHLLPQAGMVSEALGPAAQPPFVSAELLQACHVLDEQVTELAVQRDTLTSDAAAALSTYSQMLRQLLPGTYPSGACHHGWGQCLSGIMGASGPQAAAALQEAALAAPDQPNLEEVASVWKGLSLGYQWSESVTTIATGRSLDEGDNGTADLVHDRQHLKSVLQTVMQQWIGKSSFLAEGSAQVILQDDPHESLELDTVRCLKATVTAGEGAENTEEGTRPVNLVQQGGSCKAMALKSFYQQLLQAMMREAESLHCQSTNRPWGHDVEHVTEIFKAANRHLPGGVAAVPLSSATPLLPSNVQQKDAGTLLSAPDSALDSGRYPVRGLMGLTAGIKKLLEMALASGFLTDNSVHEAVGMSSSREGSVTAVSSPHLHTLDQCFMVFTAAEAVVETWGQGYLADLAGFVAAEFGKAPVSSDPSVFHPAATQDAHNEAFDNQLAPMKKTSSQNNHSHSTTPAAAAAADSEHSQLSAAVGTGGSSDQRLSLVVGRCMKFVDSACKRISELLEAAWAHQKELEEHADLLVGFVERKQDLLHKLSKLGYSVAHVDILLMECSGLQAGEEEIHHQLAVQYQDLVSKWDRRGVHADELRYQGHVLYDALEQCLTQFYDTAVGAGAGSVIPPPGVNSSVVQLDTTTALPVMNAMLALQNEQLQRSQHDVGGRDKKGGAVEWIHPSRLLGGLTAGLLQLHHTLSHLHEPGGGAVTDQPPDVDVLLPSHIFPSSLQRWSTGISAAYSIQSVLHAVSTRSSALQVSPLLLGGYAERKVKLPDGEARESDMLKASTFATHDNDALNHRLNPIFWLWHVENVCSEKVHGVVRTAVVPYLRSIVESMYGSLSIESPKDMKHAAGPSLSPARKSIVPTLHEGTREVTKLQSFSPGGDSSHLPELVKFDDFGEDGGLLLGGLEDMQLEQEQEEEDDVNSAGEVASRDIPLASVVYGEMGRAMHSAQSAGQQSNMGVKPFSGTSPLSSDPVALVHALTSVVTSASLGAMAGARVQAAASLGARVQASAEAGKLLSRYRGGWQQERLRFLATFGWLHEHVLLQQGSCMNDRMLGTTGTSEKAPSHSNADNAMHKDEEGHDSSMMMVMTPAQAVGQALRGVRDPLGVSGTGRKLGLSSGGRVSRAGNSRVSGGGQPSLNEEGVGRAQTMHALMSFVQQFPGIEQRLQLWEGTSTQAVQQVQEMLLAAVQGAQQQQQLGAAASDELLIVTQALQALLVRRQRWLTASRQMLGAIAHAASIVLHFEYSREGAAFLPGALPAGGEGSGTGMVVPDAFRGCRDLLENANAVVEKLASVDHDLSTAQARTEEAYRKKLEASKVIEAALAASGAGDVQLRSQLPLLAVGSAELSEFVAALGEGLQDSAPLLRQDVGRLLQQLTTAVARQPAAKDIAAMATRVGSQHKMVSELLEQLGTELPAMHAALGVVAERTAGSELPEAVLLAAMTDPRLVTEDPVLLAAAEMRGRCLMEELEAIVNKLGPRVQQLLDLGGALQRLLTELESLAAAAGSVAGAIQSEHMLMGQVGVEVEEDEGLLGDVNTSTNNKALDVGHDVRTGDSVPARTAVLGGGSVGGGWRWGASSGPSSARHRHADETRRRTFAAAALRRCIVKLEGRDGMLLPSSAGQVASTTAPGQEQQQQQPLLLQQAASNVAAMSVMQQADQLIRQACSVDRLSQMFEGWMPWL
ncbi:hypothetical protein CEUSTIGMA_g8375.t1 [Chlamydomonas eustigma]|uniref:non-specific serine/threonine protein kinase n=1 Tax=Chlamydomonas eustigma TaxID=1157962 RepID=A0A250XDT9_9CHLO|nr:hypothetical protein CEUSTIGMA_g8375.t1 [Chlamydomonas eustigma]|eukprot:GAX80940.1 hypothetical protein CEUSTIGMA_g8375.t1 [Chlamydomonas eustigma]